MSGIVKNSSKNTKAIGRAPLKHINQIMDKKSLESIFGDQLRAQGFKRKASSWYRQTEGGLQMVNLQKSSWGMQFYVNLCCVPNGMEVEGMPTPKEYKCPIRVRLTSAFPEQRKEIERVFDLELSGINDSERAEQIATFTRDLLLMFMDYMRDALSLRKAIEQGKFKKAWINLAAQRYLGISESEA